MRPTLTFLLAAYMLSQFYRVFLAVLSPVLQADLGITPEQLALGLGVWFASFTVMQVVVGAALDRFGPRRTTAVLMGLGGAGGAALFAAAGTPGQVYAAMALLGAGCSPVLMAGYYILAHAFRPQLFSVLAAALLGGGSLGTILGAAPLAAVVSAWGWRATMAGLAVATLLVASGLAAFARDPQRPAPVPGAPRGRLIDLLRNRGFLLILPLTFTNNAATAGIRGVWAGPWAADVHGADALTIGHVTLAMSLAMVVGTFAYGPADRILGSHKRVALWGNIGLCLALGVLVAVPGLGLAGGTAALMAVGVFGSSYPVLMAHGRAFFPPHLLGRGMTVLNLLAIGGVALAQFATAPLFRAASAAGGVDFAYRMLFLGFLLPVAVSLVFYVFAADKPVPKG